MHLPAARVLCDTHVHGWHVCHTCGTSANIRGTYAFIQMRVCFLPLSSYVQWDILSGSKVGPMANVVANECETMFLVWSEILR